MIIWLHTVQNHGHEVCWHGNSCYGNWYGSYVHADAVHPLTLWRTECREREKKKLSSMPLTILTIISVIPLLHVSFKCHQHEWLIYHLRVPPCGCPYACVCLTLWACGLCAQVLDWIENHGEAFLSKHTGVGKSLHRARALQKRHEDFEEVAQVTWFCFCNSPSCF